VWIIENGGVGSAAVAAAVEEFYSKEKRALVGDFPRSRRLDAGIFLYIFYMPRALDQMRGQIRCIA
jgi:hypothetical protein